MKEIRDRLPRLLLIFVILFPELAISGSESTKSPEGASVCGTSPQRNLEAVARGRYYRSRARLMERLGRRLTSQAASSGAAADAGDIAVLQDNGLVATDQNPFNLNGKAVRFELQIAAAYRATASSSAFDSTPGTPVTLADDDTALIQLSFSFNFYGKYYDRVQLNSDGNLTFGTGDVATSARDLSRFLAGPPRIAPFFADLNPAAGGNVSYRSVSDGMVFTWSAVPDYEAQSDQNNFSVKLFKNGDIEFIYGGRMDGQSAVVGIAPGGSLGTVNAVDYLTGLPTAVFYGPIVEVYSGVAGISETELARLFLKTHPDEFDQLIVFLAFDYRIPGAYAYELNVRNEIQGIGYDRIDYSEDYGSNGRLRSFVMMGSLDGGPNPYPSDPTVKRFRTYNTLELIAHEAAHRWLAYPMVLNGMDVTYDLLRSDRGHWSFFFNANASLMEGNRIDDRGADKGIARFAVAEVTDRYSELDRYLMGYGRKEDVPPFFIVQNPTGTYNTADTLPYLGAVFGGTRDDLTVENVVSANGPRNPSFYQSPKVHRQAFILLTKQGQQASSDQIAKLQNFRNLFVTYFNQQTGGLGYSVTNLQSTPGTRPTQLLFPYFQGSSNRYTGIAVANWGTTPADVEFNAFDNSGSQLSTPGNIINPRMITIPPGAQVAMLGEQIHGLSLDDPRNGWIQAQSSSSQVTGFFLDGDVGQNFLDGAIAGNQTYKSLYFTQTQMGSTVTSGSTFTNLIDIVNPFAAGANLTLTFVDDFGNAQGKTNRTLSPFGRLAEDLTSLFPGISKPRTKGYVSVVSDSGVVGYQAIDTGTTVYSLPAQTASTATRLYSAQFASGRTGTTQYFTDLNLINTSSQARNLRVLLVDNSGSPVSGITNPVNVVLAGGQQLRARGESIFNLPDAAYAAGFVEGSLVITADGPGVIGDVTFGDARAQKFLAGLPLDGNPVSALVFSQVAQGAGAGTKPYFTGIAFYNPNAAAVNIRIDVYSEQGAKTGTSTLLLNAGGRISRTLPELVPEITEQMRGYIRITSSGGPVSGFELFGSQNLDFLTAVPPQPINP